MTITEQEHEVLKLSKSDFTSKIFCEICEFFQSGVQTLCVPPAPEHPLDLWSLLQSVATKRTERKKAAKPSAAGTIKIKIKNENNNINYHSLLGGEAVAAE